MKKTNLRVRLTEVKFENIKSVKSGRVEFPIEKDLDKNGRNNIFGIYGPNGSGKTTLINVLAILKQMLSNEPLNDNIFELISKNKKTCKMEFTFRIESNNSFYITSYFVSLRKTDDSKQLFCIEEETLKIKEENSENYLKEIIGIKFKNQVQINEILSPACDYKPITDKFEKIREFLPLYFESATSNKSFIFNSKVLTYFSEIDGLLINSYEDIIKQLMLFGAFNLYVVDQVNSNNDTINLICRYQTDKKLSSLDGKMPVSLGTLEKNAFAEYKKSIEIANKTMSKIIPGLEVKTANEKDVTLSNGMPGVSFQLVSVRNEITIPFCCESNGIRSIFSVLSLVIAAYNDPYICVAIDEFDSGIFEHLLGKIVKIYSETGKGLFIFTSHNLRALEVLNPKNIYFTSKGEFLYKNAPYTKSTVNRRNEYLRKMSLNDDSKLMSDMVVESTLRSSLRNKMEDIIECKK